MFLTIEYKFIFIHIPKAAGEWLFWKFRNGIHSPIIAYWGLDKSNDTDLTHVYQDNSYNYIPEPLFNTYYKFVIARNPYNRFYSAYKDLIQKSSEYAVWHVKYPKYKTFTEFCNIVENQAFNDKITKHNIHIIPQYKFIMKNGKINVQKILKYENMHIDLPNLMTELNVPFIRNKGFEGKKQIHFNDINYERLQTSYMKFYTPEAIRLVNKLYKLDFEICGYEMVTPTYKMNRMIQLSPSLFDNITTELIPYSGGFKIDQIPLHYKNINYGFHIKIKNNKLDIIKDFGSFQSRNKNTIAMISNVLKKYKLPDTELLINTDDMLKSEIDNFPVFVMAKKEYEHYLTYPDHTFYNWNEAKTKSWTNERNSIISSCKKHKNKLAKILFRGNNTHYVRDYLFNQNHPTFDIKMSDLNKYTNNFVKISDHCKWKYLLHIPGISYAARLKYLMMTDSVVFYIRKKKEYEYNEFWYSQLQHMHNCIIIRDNNTYNNKSKIIKVNGKWDDTSNKYIKKQIIDYINALDSNQILYNNIIRNAKTLQTIFTYDLVLEYWYKLILNYTNFLIKS